MDVWHWCRCPGGAGAPGGSAKAGRDATGGPTCIDKDIATPAPTSRRPDGRAGSTAGWRASVLTMGRPLKMGGNAWAYLVDAVAGEVGVVADAARYYASAGTPPGMFLGRGLDGLGPCPGSVKAGDVVSPAMLHRMLAQLADPVTGEPLGRLPSVGGKAPVAGLDLTFSPPKSVSVLWAMGDQATRAAVEEVLAQAASDVIAWAEDRVFRTRTGAQGARQEPVRGIVGVGVAPLRVKAGRSPAPPPCRGAQPSPGPVRRGLADPRQQGPPPLGSRPLGTPCRHCRGLDDRALRRRLAGDAGHGRPGGEAGAGRRRP